MSYDINGNYRLDQLSQSIGSQRARLYRELDNLNRFEIDARHRIMHESTMKPLNPNISPLPPKSLNPLYEPKPLRPLFEPKPLLPLNNPFLKGGLR